MKLCFPYRTSRVWSFAGCILILVAIATQAGEVQPDRLDFGRVPVGARVQGSVRIFVDSRDKPAPKAQVAAPSFVRVDDVSEGTQEYGAGNKRGYCDIAVTIDTEKAGGVSAPLAVTIGTKRVEIPVRAKVSSPRPGQSRVLVADTPFQKCSTSDAKLFEPWLELVERHDLAVDYIEVRSDKRVLEGVDLTRFDSVLLGELGIFRLSPIDIAALRKYAEGGGRVVLTANHFFQGTVAKANLMLIPYGLETLDRETDQVGTIEVGLRQITPCPLTDGVKTLSFHRPSPAVVIDKDRTMVLVTSPTNPNEHFVAIALAGDGQIVSLGVSLWWSWVGKDDNAAFLGNMLSKRPRRK